ncbi:MAG TPA: hypothetical protein VGC89_11830 [Pyrinomonadaceae bacterium]|jgi:hypothetical protein
MRRALWETVTELIVAVSPDETEAMIQVTGLDIDLPIEMMLHETAAGVEILADLPQWRWATAFDARRGRIRLHLREGVME